MRIQEFDYSIDLVQSLLWQYNEALRLQSLLTQKQAWYDLNQTEFWTDWYRDVFNLETANDFGLTVWAIILDLRLFIGPKPNPAGKPLWGFGSETLIPNTYQNFMNGNFTNGTFGLGLTTEEKRQLLRLRYFQLTSRAAIPEINDFLKIIFGEQGAVYVLDGLDMSIAVVFTFPVGTRFLAILENYDIIPRGAGVGIRYIVDTGSVFGFGSETAEPNGNQNFTNGNFVEELE